MALTRAVTINTKVGFPHDLILDGFAEAGAAQYDVFVVAHGVKERRDRPEITSDMDLIYYT